VGMGFWSLVTGSAGNAGNAGGEGQDQGVEDDKRTGAVGAAPSQRRPGLGHANDDPMVASGASDESPLDLMRESGSDNFDDDFDDDDDDEEEEEEEEAPGSSASPFSMVSDAGAAGAGTLGRLLGAYSVLPPDWAAAQRLRGRNKQTRARRGDPQGGGGEDTEGGLEEEEEEEEEGRFAAFNEGRWAADILLSPSGRFLYVSNRLHDSIATFAVSPAAPPAAPAPGPAATVAAAAEHTGGGGVCGGGPVLVLVGHTASGGQTPRSMAMAPDGRHLVVAHQHSHSVSTFDVDAQGGLSLRATLEDFPCAACVKFLV